MGNEEERNAAMQQFLQNIHQEESKRHADDLVHAKHRDEFLELEAQVDENLEEAIRHATGKITEVKTEIVDLKSMINEQASLLEGIDINSVVIEGLSEADKALLERQKALQKSRIEAQVIQLEAKLA